MSIPNSGDSPVKAQSGEKSRTLKKLKKVPYDCRTEFKPRQKDESGAVMGLMPSNVYIIAQKIGQDRALQCFCLYVLKKF